MAFDFLSPDYASVFTERIQRLAWIEANPDKIPALKAYYRDNPWDFIDDWGMTFDPRNIDRGLPAYVPFKLMPKQREWLIWAVERWKSREPGLTEKSRDCGLSWLAVALACTLCMFHEGFVFGFGSRKEEYVDKLDSPKSLFFKARKFMEYIPACFKDGWTTKNAPHMKISFPATGSYIAGEAGDGIGRGDRAAIYIVDEAAFLERPNLVEASLSATTNCRIDVSSANGMENPFYQKRAGGKISVFTFHWRDDPRKDDAWYAKQCDELDAVTVAQEIDINYAASVTGVLIPSAWVQAAIDAHIKLGIEPTGEAFGALDVADEGVDLNAFCGAKGIVLEHLEEWSGVGSDTYATAVKAFDICDTLGYRKFRYDADGLGASVRGDARVINDARGDRPQRKVEAFRGSGGVFEPEKEDVKGRKNKDYFMNTKAQAAWSLRLRFRNTYRAVVEGKEYDADDIISIPSDLPMREKLVQQLSQPTYALNSVGKITINKTPDGMKSPNLYDSVMMRFARVKRPPMRISAAAVRET